MQLIKLDNDIFINPEHVIMLAPKTSIANTPGDPDNWLLVVGGAQPIQITDAAANYLLALLDIDDGFLGVEASAPPPRSLASRIATYLQNNANGATAEDLDNAFAYDTHDKCILTTDLIKVAVNELLAQGVIRFGPNNTLIHSANSLPSVEW